MSMDSHAAGEHAHDHAHDHDHGHGHAHDHGAAHGHDDHGHAHGDTGGHPYEDTLKHVVREPHGADDHAHHAPDGAAAEPKPLGPARKRVAVNEVTFSYVDQGAGAPILFLHGFPTSAALWRHVIAELSKTHRCVAPDLVGLGDTDAPADSDYSLDRQAERILLLMDRIGVTGEFSVVGHDWGGIVAQVIAARAPERVAKLVIMDAPAFEADPPRVVTRLVRAARWSVVWDLLCDTGFMRWFANSEGGLRAGAYDPAALSDEAIAEYIRPLYKDTPPAYRGGRERFRRAMMQVEATMGAVVASVADGMRRFEKPTLVIWGCDDPWVSVSWGKKLADEVPGCVGFELIPFCGHWVPEEKPVELAALIAAHLHAPEALPAGAAATAQVVGAIVDAVPE